MKQWLIWLLILVLALGGCNTEEPNDTTMNTQPVNTTQQPTIPAVSVYVSGSELEKQTSGAVQVYDLAGGSITGIGFQDADIVVFTYDGEKTTLTRFSAQDGMMKATAARDGLIEITNGSAGIAENRIAYYDAGQNSCIILDGTFHEIDRVKMPDGITGTPVLSSDLKTAFYCVGSEIRAMDLLTGIPRLVCQLNVQELRICGLLFDDTILSCNVTDTHGNSYAAFYSSETGENKGTDAALMSIGTWEENYLVRRMDGPVIEVLVGGKDAQLQSFAPMDASNALFVLPGIRAVTEVGYSQAGASLILYEMTQGNALGAVTLDGIASVAMPAVESTGKYIWFAAEDVETGKSNLCRWNYGTAGTDETVRLGVRYTAQNPDTAGLAECQQLAEELEQKYYVDILIHTDVVEPGDYSFVPEYQVSAYKKALQALDTAMGKFPSGFFRTVASSSDSPKLFISLVREIQPNSYDIPAVPSGYQYWINGSAYMALIVDDQVEQKFYHELSHALDTYVYGKSVHYDYWEDCNPEDFQYDESYTEYEKHTNSPYLTGENRAFIDAYSMTYAHEDRATVMEYALLDGSEAYFASDIMQAKLKVLCQGIRRAFGWRYYEGTFIWEQYLKESLAYVKKK